MDGLKVQSIKTSESNGKTALRVAVNAANIPANTRIRRVAKRLVLAMEKEKEDTEVPKEIGVLDDSEVLQPPCGT